MTFTTSQQAILKAAKPFWDSYNKDPQAAETRTIAIQSGNALLQMQNNLHPLTSRYCTAMRQYIRGYTNYLEISPKPQFHAMRVKARGELVVLMNNIQVEAEKLRSLKNAGQTAP
jgi:hypothetical protein